jgi:hypothetical protein
MNVTMPLSAIPTPFALTLLEVTTVVLADLVSVVLDLLDALISMNAFSFPLLVTSMCLVITR